MKNELTNFNEKQILEENETVFSLKKMIAFFIIGWSAAAIFGFFIGKFVCI